jgi:hypothetical protein
MRLLWTWIWKSFRPGQPRHPDVPFARRIGDKHLLHIVRRLLQAGMMLNGVCNHRMLGTPQGGPLFPLLANLLLDDLDKNLESRGHRFDRYADDCSIYVAAGIRRAGQKAMPNAWFEDLGPLGMQQRHIALNRVGTAVVRDPCARWCKRGTPRGVPLLNFPWTTNHPRIGTFSRRRPARPRR